MNTNTIRRARREGSAMADLISPPNGYRGQLQQRGKPPKDHTKINRQVLREIQNRNREERDTPKPTPKALKLKQFSQTPSRVMSQTGFRPSSAPRQDFIKKNMNSIKSL